MRSPDVAAKNKAAAEDKRKSMKAQGLPSGAEAATKTKAAKLYVAHLNAVQSAAAKHHATRGPPTAVGTNADDRAALERNKAAPGVVVLPCGLQYKVIKSAKSNAKSPKVDMPCEVHYKGKLFGSGAEFHCSYAKASEPERHVPNKSIQAWTVALQLMGVGDKWQIFLPSELGYGDAGRGRDIPPHAALTFELELVAVRSESAPPKVPRPSGMSNEELLQLASASTSNAAAASLPDEGVVATGGSPAAPKNGLFDRTTPVLDGRSKARPSSKQQPRPPPTFAGGEEGAAENAALRERLAEAEKYIEAQAARIEQLTQENGQFRLTLEKAVERAVQWSDVATRYETQLEEALEREAQLRAAAPGGTERRLDTDGSAYTYEEFVEEYGGDEEWNAAEPALND